MPECGRDNPTQLLHRDLAGDHGARARLLEAVYVNLRALAGSYLNGAVASHTLQPTALVHEAYVKLVDAERVTLADESHFMALAATAMRQVLVDHARAKGALKRGGDRQRITLSGIEGDGGTPVDLIALDEALMRLGTKSERQARVVEMRFFAGLSVAQCAMLLGVSERTIEADWRLARAWLHAFLVGGDEP